MQRSLEICSSLNFAKNSQPKLLFTPTIYVHNINMLFSNWCTMKLQKGCTKYVPKCVYYGTVGTEMHLLVENNVEKCIRENCLWKFLASPNALLPAPLPQASASPPLPLLLCLSLSHSSSYSLCVAASALSPAPVVLEAGSQLCDARISCFKLGQRSTENPLWKVTGPTFSF